MTQPAPGDIPTLTYSGDAGPAVPHIRRACAAAMVAGGAFVFAAFCRDTFLWGAFGGGEILYEWSLTDIPLYVDLAIGIVTACVIVAGIAWWRGRAARFAVWSLATWAIVSTAQWVIYAVGTVSEMDPSEEFYEWAYPILDLAAEAMPIVLPVLLWSIVRRAS